MRLVSRGHELKWFNFIVDRFVVKHKFDAAVVMLNRFVADREDPRILAIVDRSHW